MIAEAISTLKEWSQDGMKKRVYDFDEGSIDHAYILGQKGAHLCEMSKHHLPIPPGFVITSQACEDFFVGSAGLAPHLRHNLEQAVARLENSTGKKFICPEAGDINVMPPLLLSVRASPGVRLSGMTDTILNVGINDHTCDLLSKHFDNPVFALDVQQRFLMMFGSVVMHVPRRRYEEVLCEVRTASGAGDHAVLGVKALATVVERFKALAQVPDDPHEQLRMAVEAIFCSCKKHSAAVFMAINGLDISSRGSGLGRSTAVVVQEMVFGNLNSRSCTGVAFSRDPETGDPFATGEFMRQGQGEDVHRGLAPACGGGGNSLAPLDNLKAWGAVDDEERCTGGWLYCELLRVLHRLEALFRDVQQVEFTVQDGALFVLRSGPASRTPRASVKFAYQLASEGVISQREALMRLNPWAMRCLETSTPSPLLPRVEVVGRGGESSLSDGKLLGAGLAGVSSGVVSGRVVFSVEAALHCYEAGQACILIKQDASVDDFEAISIADGVVSLEGGCSCYLVEVSRPLQRTCVVGVGGVYGWMLRPLPTDNSSTGDTSKHSRRSWGVYDASGSLIIEEGRVVTLDGTSGCVIDGRHDQERLYGKGGGAPELGMDLTFHHLLHWADQFKSVRVFGDVTSPEDAYSSARFGSDSVLLVRLASLLVPAGGDSAGEGSAVVAAAATARYILDRATCTSVHSTSSSEPAIERSRGCHLPALPSKERILENTEADLISQLQDMYLSSPGKLACVLLSSSFPPSIGFTSGTAVLPAELSLTGVERLAVQEAQHCREGIARAQSTHRLACRRVLNSVNKESLQMQVRAVFTAAVQVINDGKKRMGMVEFLIPLRGGVVQVGEEPEEEAMITLIQAAALEAFDASRGVCVPYSVGVMVQTPRACLVLDRIARNSVISTVMFDCDALTELVFGMSKADTECMMKTYQRKGWNEAGFAVAGESGGDDDQADGCSATAATAGDDSGGTCIMSHSPFERLDEQGVGGLLLRAARLFRKNEASGVPLTPLGCYGRCCCQHPDSLRFLLEDARDLDLSFLCCPPEFVPVVKIAAAQVIVLNYLTSSLVDCLCFSIGHINRVNVILHVATPVSNSSSETARRD